MKRDKGAIAICVGAVIAFGYMLIQEVKIPNSDVTLHWLWVVIFTTLSIKYTLFGYRAYRYGTL